MESEMETVELRGYVQDVTSKCGVRFVDFGAVAPYGHSVMLEVSGDEGREDDDRLTGDLYPFCTGEVIVTAKVVDRDLYARPSDFRLPTPDRSGEADETP
jgi:hypothetical protein